MLNYDAATKRATWDGKFVRLSVTEIDVLDLLRDGKMYTRAQIKEKVGLGGDDLRTVDTIIKRIRKKLPGAVIETMYGAGYRGIPANISWRTE